MYLKHLGYLELVVRHVSFARPTVAAGVSQPAISQAMRAREQHWGVDLFEKMGHKKMPCSVALAATQQAK